MKKEHVNKLHDSQKKENKVDFENVPSKKVNRIVWAIDPFETEVSLDPPTVAEFDQWAKDNGIVIQPVFVFTPFSDVERLAREKIASQISELLRELKIDTNPPHILLRSMESGQSAPLSLLSYAQNSDTDLIVVSSHGRRGFSRMLFGSFAETLLQTSPIPLLFLNKNPRPVGASFRHALWATDFSKSCEFAYNTFLSQASGGLCKEITLFHDVTLPLELSLYFSQWDVGVPPRNELIESQTLWANQESADWVSDAIQKGFQAQFVTEASCGRVANEILAAASDNGTGVIAMASQSGPFESAILGSHAREVFRASQLPVWIYGPQVCAVGKSKVKESKEQPSAASKIQRGQDESGLRIH